MKFIHCSDIHLDSSMKNFNESKARERRDELRLSFSGMISYAISEGVKAIIIAGDLFDSVVLKKTKEYIYDEIKSNQEVDFLYLSGNHDESNFMEEFSKSLPNLKILSTTPVIYDNVCIYGFSPLLESEYDKLLLDNSKTNIVVMHGQVDNYTIKKDYICLRKLKGKGIDYLAMGHIHSFNEYELDKGVSAVYSGCLEGRGFDEVGEKGFVMLSVENKKVNYSFLPFSKRKHHVVSVDITGKERIREIDGWIIDNLVNISQKDLVKVELVGEVGVEAVIDCEHISKMLSDRFYFVKVSDKTRLKLSKEQFENDISLKGVFIKKVLNSGLSEKEQETIIRYGIKALNGEEIE